MARSRPVPASSSAAQAVEQRVSPWKLGGLGVRELGKRLYKEAWTDEIMDRAAGLAYYFLFALFPALLFLTSLLGMLPIPDLMNRLMSYVEQTLPGDAASVIQKTLGEIVRGAHGGLLSIGALAALWAASAGLASMMTALNVAYGVEDTRPWWKRRAIAVALTLALSLLVLSAMVLLVFGGPIGRFLGDTIGLGNAAVMAWNIAQYPVAIAFVVAGVALLYFVAPAVEQRTWYWVTPGSIVATVAWIGMSLGLRLYVTQFGNYGATYGSIAGVILLMLWLYLAGLVILLGAEINSEIEHAAAAQGAPTAKAEGELAPGVPGPPPRAQQEVVERDVAERVALRGQSVPLPGAGPFAQSATARVADAGVGAAHTIRALPWVAAWGSMRLVARVTGRLAGRRRRRTPRDYRRAA
ncbi:MAG: YihY/virulence factor BrkB family protein [Candidatus Rokubacteria bacterium]|nr:YihY/virulence factor BrkB family protein [Candidatus Rokubacteria bacterium]